MTMEKLDDKLCVGAVFILKGQLQLLEGVSHSCEAPSLL